MSSGSSTDWSDYVPARGRRAEARRRRKQRQRRLVAGVVVVALVATAAVTFWLVRRGSDPAPDVQPQGRTQQTLLLQVRAPDGAGLASALLAHDPEADGEDGPTSATVLVPPQVIVEVPGAGSVPFAQALLTGDPNGSRNALADLLGVTVDGSWVLDTATFVALVDQLGGLSVQVDVPVLQDSAVVVPQGTQQLDGARAHAYLTYLAPGEPEEVRLNRVNTVLEALLAALPEDVTAMADLLAGLGPGSAMSQPATEVARLLDGVRSGADSRARVLPTIPIDTGVGATTARLDEAAAAELVDLLLAQSVPPGQREGGNRVLVLNGVGTPGLGEAVRNRLVEAGFVFVGSRNDEPFDDDPTVVLVPESTPEAQRLGEEVADALGVPANVQQANLGSIADVVVVVGPDFVP